MPLAEGVAWFLLPYMLARSVVVTEWRWGKMDIAANKAMNRGLHYRLSGSAARFYDQGRRTYFTDWKIEGGPRYYTRWSGVGGAADRALLLFLPELSMEPPHRIQVAQLLSRQYVLRVQTLKVEEARCGANVNLEPLMKPAEWLMANYPDYAIDPDRRELTHRAWAQAVLPGDRVGGDVLLGK